MLVELLAALVIAAPPGLKAGDRAPDFSAPATNGKTVQLSDFKGKWLVLYFFPKAFTPGCTAQACSLRDGMASLKGTDAVVLGVSLDELDIARKFKAENNLPFELLSDTKKDIAKAYGVLGIMELFAIRRTFIIAPDGTIAEVIHKVDTNGHAAQVKRALDRLAPGS